MSIYSSWCGTGDRYWLWLPYDTQEPEGDKGYGDANPGTVSRLWGSSLMKTEEYSKELYGEGGWSATVGIDPSSDDGEGVG